MNRNSSLRLWRFQVLTPLVAIVSASAMPRDAKAQTVVYDNGSYIGTPFGGYDITNFAVADDFLVTSSLSFNAIRFYAADTSGSLLPNFSGTLSWFLYSGSAGLPSPNAIPSTAILASGTTSSVTVTDTGHTFSTYRIGQLDFSIPTQTLGPGIYWLRLKENGISAPSDGSAIAWMTTAGAPNGNGYRVDSDEVTPTLWNEAGTSTTEDLSFQLRSGGGGSLVPEAPGALLLLPGLLPVAAMALKRRQANK